MIQPNKIIRSHIGHSLHLKAVGLLKSPQILIISNMCQDMSVYLNPVSCNIVLIQFNHIQSSKGDEIMLNPKLPWDQSGPLIHNSTLYRR
jgi:hypothetical protein